MASLLSAACMAMGWLVLTSSTVTPLDNIGVMTMKMMSMTSITSTIGGTLMSATGGGAVNFTFSPVIVSPQGFARSRGAPPGPPANQLASPILNETDYINPITCGRRAANV